MKPGRISCVVPFCRRTASADKFAGQEIICGKHWRMVSKTVRRRHSLLARRYRRRFGDNGWWAYPPGSEDRLEAVRIATICDQLWSQCKRQAIEHAAGL